MEGTIARVVEQKGFGFIKAEGADGDIFFHMSALKNSSFTKLKSGQKVTFDLTDSSKGARAENVYVE
jgi:cold shock protein